MNENNGGTAAVDKQTDFCIRCGQPLSILAGGNENEEPVRTSRGEMCSQCYRDLWKEEIKKYF